jgi:hypothetical protein
MQVHGLRDCCKKKIVPQKMDEIEIQHMSIGAILRCVTKYFYMTIKPYSLCKYKVEGLQETFVVLHHHSCKGLSNQSMQ